MRLSSDRRLHSKETISQISVGIEQEQVPIVAKIYRTRENNFTKEFIITIKESPVPVRITDALVYYIDELDPKVYGIVKCASFRIDWNRISFDKVLLPFDLKTGDCFYRLFFALRLEKTDGKPTTYFTNMISHMFGAVRNIQQESDTISKILWKKMDMDSSKEEKEQYDRMASCFGSYLNKRGGELFSKERLLSASDIRFLSSVAKSLRQECPWAHFKEFIRWSYITVDTLNKNLGPYFFEKYLITDRSLAPQPCAYPICMGFVDREQSEALLNEKSPGTLLFRISVSDPSGIAVSCRDNNRVIHFLIKAPLFEPETDTKKTHHVVQRILERAVLDRQIHVDPGNGLKVLVSPSVAPIPIATLLDRTFLPPGFVSPYE